VLALTPQPGQATAAEPACDAPDLWFAPSGTPQVIDDFKIDDDEDECSFYRWAWQSFLWLNQSDAIGDPPRFTRFKTLNQLFPKTTMPPLANTVRANAKPNRLSLSVRTAPGTSRDVTAMATSQAGSQGVVVDQNGRAVYYGIHFNDKFEAFLKNKLDDPTSPGLNLQKPSDIPLIKSDAQFPPGCLELKSAWRVLSAEEKEHVDEVRQRFLVLEAEVPTLVQLTSASGALSIHADATRPIPETVALVALHVVGTIVNHPEFIWASFEHKENAPVLPNQNLPSSSPVSANLFTFYRPNKKLLECNINPVKDTKNPLALVDPMKQTLKPVTDLYRQFNSGDDAETADGLVDNLNRSVAKKLPAILSVWKNYQLMGAVWMKDTSTNFVEGLVPGDDILIGEIRLSNTVMETYTQITQKNCFSCHTTAEETDKETGRRIPDLRVKVSHILRNSFFSGD
jgi:hypothetical protein